MSTQYIQNIGVFDSGVGGESVASAIKQKLPESNVVYVSDSKNIPYGTKSPDELYELVEPILQKLAKHVDVIVIACNTVSTTLAPRLRKTIKVPIVAIEPMVKPAAEMTSSGVVAVCATPTTLASKRYQELKDIYVSDVLVIEPDCSDWAAMIESKKIDREKIARQVNDVCENDADVIVLGCTHYHWIEEIIKEEAAGRAQVLQPEQAVIKQLERVLSQTV
jgi:glutamate racemase